MLKIQDGQFYMEEKPFHIYSGAMHYFRIPRCYWEDRLLKLKAAGFNTVETYTCWNLHEPHPDEFHFDGMLDIAAFLKTAQKVGLYAIVRPGPYICAEWDFGGLPAWLLKDRNMRLRCNYVPYLERVKKYYAALSKEISPLLQKNGGNIIAVQVENEYGSYGNDKPYLQSVLKIMEETGLADSFLFTSDGDCDFMLAGGGLPGIFKALNFGSRSKTAFPKLKAYQENAPYMCAEFWDGWFDHWAEKHHTRPSGEVIREIQNFLDLDASFNMYMFHGGTNFGFTAGANHDKAYQPTVTSYDYNAPLTEWGAYTETYHKIRKMMHEKQNLPLGELPPEPKLQNIGRVELTESTGLFENLQNIGEFHHSPTPENMEFFDQNFGYILYSTTLKGNYGAGILSFEGVHDNAYVFVDGKLKKTYYRHENKGCKHADGFTMPFMGCKEACKIEILVEAMGRVNYGKALYDRKGIERVCLGNQTLFDFDVCCLPMETLENLDFTAGAEKFPKFFKGTFKASTDADCFIAPDGFKKGCIFVNGVNLGRYWEIGPQWTLYVPKDVLKEENEILIFEQEGCSTPYVTVTDTPQLSKNKKRFCFFK